MIDIIIFILTTIMAGGFFYQLSRLMIEKFSFDISKEKKIKSDGALKVQVRKQIVVSMPLKEEINHDLL